MQGKASARFSLRLTEGLTFCSDEVLEIISSNQELMRQLHSVVDKYLNKCGRRWVDLSDIFSFARLAM